MGLRGAKPWLSGNTGARGKRRREKTPCLSAPVMNIVTRSGPEGAIQSSILNCFGDVAGFDDLTPRQVGYGAGDLEDTIVRPGAEPLLDHGALQQVLGIGAQLAVLADFA